MVGRKVKVLLSDVDPVRWRQDLAEDRGKLAVMHAAARAVTPDRDAKLADLRDRLRAKVARPLNPGNTKALVFTAFADTARYLYEQPAPLGEGRTGPGDGAGHRVRREPVDAVGPGAATSGGSSPRSPRTPRAGRRNWPTRANWTC